MTSKQFCIVIISLAGRPVTHYCSWIVTYPGDDLRMATIIDPSLLYVLFKLLDDSCLAAASEELF